MKLQQAIYLTNRVEKLEYVLNRARNFIRVSKLDNLSPATLKAWRELGEAVAGLEPKREKNG